MNLSERITVAPNICHGKPMEDWIRNNWGSRAHFLSDGFGMATVCGIEVVAWSVADCASEGVCEIGIHTAREWRQKGMGTFTAKEEMALD